MSQGKREDIGHLLNTARHLVLDGQVDAAMWRVADALGELSKLASPGALGQPGIYTGLGNALASRDKAVA